MRQGQCLGLANSTKGLLSGVCRLLLLGCLLGGRAYAAPAPASLLFDIAPQELGSALEAFSRSSGMAVLVDRKLTRGRRSIGLKGYFSTDQGLSVLLTGTGLMARYTRADAFTLRVAQVAEVAVPQGQSAKGTSQLSRSYAVAVQSAVERRLCASALTRPGSFRALLQLWIGRDGAVQHSRLVTSSGDLQRDAALVESVRQLRIEQSPPSSLRQPVTLLLLPDSSGKPMDCKQWEGASGG